MEHSDTEDFLAEDLFNLKRKAETVEDDIITIVNKVKVAQQKLKLELQELSETELRSRPSLRYWLQSRNLPENCSFQEFFEAFLEEHQRESRLFLSDRTISLNKDACKLFGSKGRLSILEILERLPLLYH
jgi:hypothetical protein